MSDTPETDAAKISIGHIHGKDCWWVDADISAKLERERDSLKVMQKAEIQMRKQAERERDEARAELQTQLNNIKQYDYHYQLHVAERDQLRKVVDEMNRALLRQLPISAHLGEVKWDAINLYNSLPHVIERNKK